MRILHASPAEAGFLVWAEASPESGGAGPVRRRGRPPKAPKARPHPFAAPYDDLAASLRPAVPGLTAGKGGLRTAAAWLPSRGGAPLPSSPLLAENGGATGATEILAWIVPAVRLTGGQVIEFLCACRDKQTLAPGTAIGPDLAFWAQAVALAGSLVLRQQVLPDLAEEGGAYRARWIPILSGEDAERSAGLARRMPPAARALSDPEAKAAPDLPAAETLAAFLTVAVDALVRSGAREAGPASFDSLHDRWLHALRADGGAMEGDAGDLARLAGEVRAWRRPVSVESASPVRLCFRLEEPDDRDADPRRAARRKAPSDWRVRFLLQPLDDRSLLVPVADLWKARGRGAARIRRAGIDPREYALSALGQASGICPRIEGSLREAIPSGYDVDATGAHEFLTETSAALEQAGFGVMLPAWWTRKGTKIRLAARANVKAPALRTGSGLSLDEILDVDWQLALGDERLSIGELRALAALKAPLVRVRGQWVELNAEEIRTALDFWRKKNEEPVTARDLVRLALGAEAGIRGLPIAGVAATGWIGEILKELDGRAAIEELPPPAGFTGTLRPYQARGFAWLAFLRRWGLGACLADDMGLGKTIQTLALIQRDWEANGRRPVLLISPTSVVANWRKEAARFTPDLPVMVHHGVERKKGAAFRKAAAKHAIVVSSYALLHRDHDHFAGVKWAGVVLDEAQNIKNPETKQAHAARSIPAGYRIALTGTPVENNVGDLWSIMEFLNPGFLGTQSQFRRVFFIPIQAKRDPDAAARLKRLAGPFVLRRLKTDRTIIADLPEKLEMKVFCTLTKEQASLYAAVVREAEKALKDAKGIGRKGLVLATLSKLKQVCNHPAQFLGDNSSIPDRSGKVARVTEMLEEILEVGERALVFTQFSEMGEILRRHLLETFGREILFLHGAVPKGKRDRMVERFQEEGGPAVFILSLKAGGTGLNLTRAGHVFHFDRWWNPAVEDQATDRAFRIGQTRNVQVHKFLCAGTLEEKIDEMIERKKAVAGEVIGAGEGWITEMSNEELKDLFALRREAIGE
ncbi:MAG: DEAD/DEAH box helicase family protein [Planctomycetes bacterium]|nr:DEAD/DEAH box helicase family protein [Planctomycetota bacterium]